MLPHLPEDDSEEVRHRYSIDSQSLKTVAEYARISLPEVLQLNVLDFLALRRDAFISALSRTEKGQELLEEAWIGEQTVADRQALREMI